ncbi:MAG: glycosyltransferase [Sphingobacteriaceae bacterium]|nr:glycosyltransferase [Sphingobacteriaceae bacterium]
MRACDVLICPSFSEGFPNVILEAMSNGLAVAATNVGAVELFG